MALASTHTNYAYGTYKEDRNDLIKQYENAPLYASRNDPTYNNLNAHDDRKQHIAFGYGYDLFQNLSKLKSDLSGFVVATSYPNDITKVIPALDEVYNLIVDNTVVVNGKRVFKTGVDHQQVVADINAQITMQTEANAEALLAYKLDQYFENSVPLSLLPESKERAAVMSQLYRLGTGGAPSMLQAIQDGNRAEAWYQIRYESNFDNMSGNYERVIKESDIFGLYDTAPNTRNSKDIIRMARIHAEKIIVEENKSADYNGHEIGPQIQSAKSYLIANFSQGITIDGEVIVGVNSVNDELWRGVGIGDIHDSLQGTLHNDLIFGENGSDTLSGNDGNDVIYGGFDRDTISGGAGSDMLEGGQGDDVLIGSVKGIDDGVSDTLKGGADFDTYIVGNHDVIEDDVDSKGKIEFKDIDFTGTKTENDQTGYYEDDDFRYEESGNTLTVTALNGGETITINNWDASTHEGLGISLQPRKDIEVYVGDASNPEAAESYSVTKRI
jgi:hypothetical protein